MRPMATHWGVRRREEPKIYLRLVFGAREGIYSVVQVGVEDARVSVVGSVRTRMWGVEIRVLQGRLNSNYVPFGHSGVCVGEGRGGSYAWVLRAYAWAWALTMRERGALACLSGDQLDQLLAGSSAVLDALKASGRVLCACQRCLQHPAHVLRMCSVPLCVHRCVDGVLGIQCAGVRVR